MEVAEQKLRSLEKLDDGKGAGSGWNWFTIRTILTSGAGFFTDSYDIFIINLVTPMLGYVYYSAHGNKLPADIEGVVKGMTSVGTLLGQLFFGFAGDILGRKIYGVELLIIIIGTINCATSASSVRGVSAIAFLGLWRLVLGFGIGGDYPMSATIVSEWSTTGRRGMMMALIFSMQGIGNLAAAIVTLILLAIFKNAIIADVMNLDYVWRLCIGLGAVPAVGTIYLRFTMPESPRYALNVEHDVEAAAAAKGQEVSDELAKQYTKVAEKRNHWAEFRAYFRQWKHLKVLLGTSLSWFLLDIAFYGLGLNNTYVLEAIGFADQSTPFAHLWNNTVGQIIITCLGSVPGYYLTVIFVERWGRRPIQIMGFAMCTILFMILAAAYHQLRENSMPAFIFLFTLAQLFQNFGANSTTFIIPGEVFPTKVRASAHGISAASGKAGAILASFAFNVVVDSGGAPGKHAFLDGTLGIFAAIMFLGLVVTILWIPESKGRDLDYFEEDYVDPAAEITSQTNEPETVPVDDSSSYNKA
ncbi:major facilitator superfamily domain-containing protein [Syncephalastrum racemosum]|uniref:Major facilitator superfamily domain-containing protein n=1 Tax=Syncephalastrum racemosum TaxID=13706 RepID=A0A1X2HLF7_SYNRA|nr:major facilitator superfamily domain-containing protein [Syncephalastrum racemosum]